MSNKSRIITAIDIGTTKIVAIAGKRHSNGKFEIMGIGSSPSKGVWRGMVRNIEETVNSIRTAVDKASHMANVEFRQVYVGIAGQNIRSIRTRGDLIREHSEDEISQEEIDSLTDKMKRLSMHPGEEILHVLPQSYIVDEELIDQNPKGMNGKRLEGNFHIVIGQVSLSRHIVKCVEKLGMEVIDLILEPLASARAALTEDEKEAGVAMIDIGGGTTDVAVYLDTIIKHTAVIPLGGNVVTMDIKDGCKVLHREAESLKVKSGSALSSAESNDYITIPGISGREEREISFRTLATIIQYRMEEILGFAQYEIESSGVMDKLSAGMVITGGGSLLRNLPQLIKHKLGYDVRVGYPNEVNLTRLDDEINHPMYATAVGLLIYGAEYEDQYEVNYPGHKLNTKKVGEMGSKIFNSMKTKFGKIFDEKDTKL